MQEKLNILSDLISKSNLSINQKKLAEQIINKLIIQLYLTECNFQKRLKKDTKIKYPDFIDYYDRVHTLLDLFNISEIDLITMNFNYYEWIKKHISEVKYNNITFDVLKKLCSYLEIYEGCYSQLPFNMVELKSFILEPLELKVDYETDLNEALLHFRKTGEKKPIMSIGWAKMLFKQLKEEQNNEQTRI